MRIATWNLERPASSHIAKIEALQAQMRAVDADIWILTETNSCVSPGSDYEVVPSVVITGPERYAVGENRTTIWSRIPICSIIETHDPETAVCAEVKPGTHPVLIYGTIIPYHAAGTRYRYRFEGEEVVGKTGWELLRAEVFVDLYRIVSRGLRIGEDSYSIKRVERLYRAKRATDVATAVDSVVQYARWIESHESTDWRQSQILKAIRDYNEDDCISTAELLDWLRRVAKDRGIGPVLRQQRDPEEARPTLSPEVEAGKKAEEALRQRDEPVASILADLLEFHRREDKPMWWRMFDRAASTPDVLRDDPGCIEGVQADGDPTPVQRSQVQDYTFEPLQEIKLAAGERSDVVFSHATGTKFNLLELDGNAGTLSLKSSTRNLQADFDGEFPDSGSLLQFEFVSAKAIATALSELAASYLEHEIPASIEALLTRRAPAATIQADDETTVEAAIRVSSGMDGECLVIQGPPGTGKSYTASRMIAHLIQQGKRIGIASNSHKAINNLLEACSSAMAESGDEFTGVKVGGDDDLPIFEANPGLRFVKSGADAFAAFSGGVVGGTAWLFTRPEWNDTLDFLFIDEAGQVALANAVATARSARNLVLLGDQMQLEQPVQGSHPGDSGLSALQYALKDESASCPDAPVFHAVVPRDYGLFLGESRRMHPDVCRFISASIYEGRLHAFPDCARQQIETVPDLNRLVPRGSGIVFSGVEHDGNVQQSDEETQRVCAIYDELCGRDFTAQDGSTRPLGLADFLFIAPYNAQVRALEAALPKGARVGSVDKFQGQEAPVCILSLCSSFGEYGSRGLGFILDRNRINVAISRAQALAIIVADPRIATTPPGSLAEMSLINLFCKILSEGTQEER